MKSTNIIKNPLSTEKAIHMLEENGTLVFVVERRAKKPEIKAALEELYAVKVRKINTLITNEGRKRAFVTLEDADQAMDLATKLGLM
jgi:ribosomal protein uL23